MERMQESTKHSLKFKQNRDPMENEEDSKA